MVNRSAGLDAVFGALADPTRRAIVASLAAGEASVSELARPHPMSLPAVLKHLQVLERAGLVAQAKSGRVRTCRLLVHPLKDATDWLARYRQFWDQQLDSLGRYLKGDLPMALPQTALPSLQLKRTYPAPRQAVFRAWTEPGEIERWFAPSDDYSVLVPELELRVGGSYCIEMRHQDGTVHRAVGTYREIKPAERLAFTWRWADHAEETLVTVEFHTVGKATELVLTHEQFASFEARDKHDAGWNGCLARLARLFPD